MEKELLKRWCDYAREIAVLGMMDPKAEDLIQESEKVKTVLPMVLEKRDDDVFGPTTVLILSGHIEPPFVVPAKPEDAQNESGPAAVVAKILQNQLIDAFSGGRGAIKVLKRAGPGAVRFPVAVGPKKYWVSVNEMEAAS